MLDEETQVPGADACFISWAADTEQEKTGQRYFLHREWWRSRCPHDPMNCSISSSSILESLHGLKPGCIIIHADLWRDLTGKPILAVTVLCGCGSWHTDRSILMRSIMVIVFLEPTLQHDPHIPIVAGKQKGDSGRVTTVQGGMWRRMQRP